jgi:ABC-type sugar transport system ATPase subunit
VAAIVLRSISKRFTGGHEALHHIDLVIDQGERIALVGPSGSGKSTLLRIIAGLETPTTGRITIDGVDVTLVPPEKRDLAMVFQSYALYPHKTVRQNLAFGLRVRGLPRNDVERRVNAVADSLGLTAMLDRRPAQLSGGQRQRVALGRAIVREPRAFLLDEPLSNLDPRLRGETRAELVALHRRLGATMVYVTHDQEEAMTLGQRIAVLQDGRIEQVGPPAALYQQPASTFVGTFIGTPPMNLLSPRELPAGGGVAVPPSAVTIGIRPHDVRITSPGAAHLRAVVDLVEPLGHAQVVHLDLAGRRVLSVVPPDAALSVGATVGIEISEDRMHCFGADGRRLSGQ